MKITDIRNTKWRDELMPASFRGVFFHVETGARENGRRIVLHEFPKKSVPYPEDMGRRAFLWTVRGYCIAYPMDTPQVLYSRDYRDARNALIGALETEGPAMLQLPTMPPMMVVCSQYRWTEETRLGGYCSFDMTFMEYGVPTQTQPSTAAELKTEADALKQQIVAAMTNVDNIILARKLAAQGLQGLIGPG